MSDEIDSFNGNLLEENTIKKFFTQTASKFHLPPFHSYGIRILDKNISDSFKGATMIGCSIIIQNGCIWHQKIQRSISEKVNFV